MVLIKAQRVGSSLRSHTVEQDVNPSVAVREHLNHLYQNFPVHSFHRGQDVQLDPQKIWVVLRGVVLLNTLHPSGDEALLGFAVPSMPLGLPLTQVMPYSAIALSDAELLLLSLEEIGRSPTIQQALAQQLTRRLQQSESMTALLGLRRVEDRLKQFLMLLAQSLGEPLEGGNGLVLSVRLTHQHLANALGTTRVTVTRILNQLRSEGWLEITPARYIVVLGDLG
jgi:CRP-like cAMP-binding protein